MHLMKKASVPNGSEALRFIPLSLFGKGPGHESACHDLHVGISRMVQDPLSLIAANFVLQDVRRGDGVIDPPT